MRIGCLAIAVCCVLQVGVEVFWRNTCGHLAIDYCALWSAGRVANNSGYSSIYNLGILGRVEQSISPASTRYAFATSPVAYLPIFIVPFQLLARLNPATGYWIWALTNLLGLGFYLRFFVRRMAGAAVPPLLLGMSLLSLPVYWNFFDGQVNVWLAICVGEAVRMSLSGRRFQAGLWLAGLLLKPQFLILIVPVLLLQQSWRTFGGLIAGAFATLGVSLRMIGSTGFGSLLALWLGFGKGMPTNDVGMMMNWRMVGSALGAVSAPLFGLTIIAAGSIITVAAVWLLWRRKINLQSGGSATAWLGLLAATIIIAWHAHVHTAVILLPLLLLLVVQNEVRQRIFAIWVFLPAALYFGAFLMAAGISAGLLPAAMGSFVDFARGIGEFGMSLYLLWWTLRQMGLLPRMAARHRPAGS